MSKFRDWMFNNLYWILTIFVLIAYVAYGTFKIEKTGSTVLEIIADSAITLFLGVSIVNFLGLQGEIKGENDEDVISTQQAHAEAYESVAGIWHLSDSFCSMKNEQALKTVRTDMLRNEGLRYSDFYTNDGVFKDYISEFPMTEDKLQNKAIKSKNKQIRIQNKALKKSIEVKITFLTPSNLSSTLSKPKDPLYRGRGQADFHKYRFFKTTISKILLAVLSGLYAARFIGMDKGMMLYRGVIGLVMVMSGLIEYFIRWVYVTKERRRMQIGAIKDLQEMKNLYNLGILTEEVEYGFKGAINSTTVDGSEKTTGTTSIGGTTTIGVAERTDFPSTAEPTISTGEITIEPEQGPAGPTSILTTESY